MLDQKSNPSTALGLSEDVSDAAGREDTFETSLCAVFVFENLQVWDGYLE